MRLFKKLLLLVLISAFCENQVFAFLYVSERQNAFQSLRSNIEYCEQCAKIISAWVDVKNIQEKIKLEKDKIFGDSEECVEKLIQKKERLMHELDVASAKKRSDEETEAQLQEEGVKTLEEEMVETNALVSDKLEEIKIDNLLNCVEAVKLALFKVEILSSDFVWKSESLRKAYKSNTFLKESNPLGILENSKKLKQDLCAKLYAKFFPKEAPTRRLKRYLLLKKVEIAPSCSENDISNLILNSKVLPDKFKQRVMDKLGTALLFTTDLRWWLRVMWTERPYSKLIIHNFLKLKAAKNDINKKVIAVAKLELAEAVVSELRPWLIHYLDVTPEFKKDEIARCLAELLKHEILKS